MAALHPSYPYHLFFTFPYTNRTRLFKKTITTHDIMQKLDLHSLKGEFNDWMNNVVGKETLKTRVSM